MIYIVGSTIPRVFNPIRLTKNYLNKLVGAQVASIPVLLCEGLVRTNLMPLFLFLTVRYCDVLAHVQSTCVPADKSNQYLKWAFLRQK